MSEKKKHRVIIGIELFLLCMILATLSINATSANPPSNGVSYNKNNQTTVQNALDDLYNKANYGNATASQILKGRTALVGGKPVTGTLTIPTLASLTPGDATKENIDVGKIAWVNGEKIVGTGIRTSQTADILRLGEYINYTPSKTSYRISREDTGYESDQTINPSELNLWRVLRKNEDGTVDLVSANSSNETVIIAGETGYQYYIGTLNEIARAYENSLYTVGSRHLGYDPKVAEEYCIDGVSSCPEDKGYETDIALMEGAHIPLSVAGDYDCSRIVYYLASRFGVGLSDSFYVYGVARGDCAGEIGWHVTTGMRLNPSTGLRVRPVVTLRSDLKYKSGFGTATNPVVLSS